MASNPSLPGPRGAGEVLADAVRLQEAGRLGEAEAALRRAIALAPDHAEAHARLGWVLGGLARHDEAIAAQRRAIEIQPRFAGAWSNLGVALQAKGDHDGALAAMQHALTLDDGIAECHVNIGLEWQARGMAAQAARSLRRAAALDPGLVQAWTNLGIALQEAGDVRMALAASRRALGMSPGDRAARSNALMTAQYDGEIAMAALRHAAVQAAPAFGAERPLPSRRRDPGARIRVGYLSADLWSHPVGWMAARALVAHDRHAFEVHCFADHAVDDAVSREIRAGVEHWHGVRGLDDESLRAFILARGIDVLVDLAGHTAGSRLAVFAARAAPVQLAWLGYAASTGLATMDGVLVGEALAPPGAEAAFSEPLVRLPRLHFTYRPPDGAPPVSPPPAARTGTITLGSFNNPAKIGRETIAAWAAAMAAVTGSRLVLKWRSLADAESAQRVRRRFAIRGIDPARIEVRGPSPHAAMLAEYGDVDIALDSFPYGGGLTTCEALWMGVPVVTMPWLRPLSRQALAVLEAIGLPDLVARTPREFAAIVARLAADAGRRAALRDGLRERMRASALFDGRSLAAALEQAFSATLASREVS